MKFDRAELARDLMGLGSIPFLVLVLVRVAMAGNFLEFFHISVSVVLVWLASLTIRGIHFHSATIVILVIFTSVFYDDYFYTAFAALTGIIALYGFVRYLKKEHVYRSVFLALLASLLSYLISLPLGIPNI